MFGWFRRNVSPEEIQEIRQIQLAIARDLAQLVKAHEDTRQDLADSRQEFREDLAHLAETVSVQASNISGLVQVAEALTADVASLKAGQEQQARVLDYLLSKEQERQNGGG